MLLNVNAKMAEKAASPVRSSPLQALISQILRRTRPSHAPSLSRTLLCFTDAPSVYGHADI
jgi:hypothetical protein